MNTRSMHTSKDSLVSLIWMFSAYFLIHSSQASASHTLTSDQLLLLERSYYNAIIKNTDLDITPAQLDAALRQIIGQPHSDIPYSAYECQPRPHVVSRQELEQQVLQSQHFRHRSSSSIVSASQCFLLHRCERSSGCCHGNSECMSYEEEAIQVPVTVHTLGTWTMTMEYIQLVNHTSCRCRGEIQECICPHPLKSEYSQDRFDCSCRCDPTDDGCHGFLNGTNSLNWTRSNVPWNSDTTSQSLALHQSCIHHTNIGNGHYIGRHCPEIPCRGGRKFNPDTVACEFEGEQLVTVLTSSDSGQLIPEENQDIAIANSQTDSDSDALSIPHDADTTSQVPAVTRSQRSDGITSRSLRSYDIESRSITRATFSEEQVDTDEMSIFRYVIERGLNNVRNDMRKMRKTMSDIQIACSKFTEEGCGRNGSEYRDILLQPSKTVRIHCKIPEKSCGLDQSLLRCPSHILSLDNCYSEHVTRVRHKRKARRKARTRS